MIFPETWPNFTMTDKEATRKLVEFYHLESLVKFGKTKLFIRTPKTVYYLEEQREAKMPYIVSTLHGLHEMVVKFTCRSASPDSICLRGPP